MLFLSTLERAKTAASLASATGSTLTRPRRRRTRSGSCARARAWNSGLLLAAVPSTTAALARTEPSSSPPSLRISPRRAARPPSLRKSPALSICVTRSSRTSSARSLSARARESARTTRASRIRSASLGPLATSLTVSLTPSLHSTPPPRSRASFFSLSGSLCSIAQFNRLFNLSGSSSSAKVGPSPPTREAFASSSSPTDPRAAPIKDAQSKSASIDAFHGLRAISTPHP
mmetsp:Transcript_1105/g.3908  ORF Transcript_1105/g.3908 Transcript_1105/m.3908 type:complete len:231 (-) Transcript_1105:90-782(-)